tara:strand:- start:2065 stop:2187 length:123 start_codon:yes stop_codon:yes gene_type:complete
MERERGNIREGERVKEFFNIQNVLPADLTCFPDSLPLLFS